MGSKRWNVEDKIKLMELYSKGSSFDEIGNILGRSSNAIKLRLESLIYSNIIKGKSVEVLSQMLNTDPDKIRQMYYLHKSFKQTRGEQVDDIDLSKNSQHNNQHNNQHNSQHNLKYSKIMSQEKLQEIEYENRILEAIIKNNKLKNELKNINKN